MRNDIDAQNVSALEEQKALRRAEVKIAAAAKAIREIGPAGEDLIARMGADHDPKAAKLRREYAELSARIEAVAHAAQSTHHAAEELCRGKGADILENIGTPKRVIAQWILGQLPAELGKRAVAPA